MLKFKAVVKDKNTKETVFIESEQKTKAAFISDLKSNGYMVNPDRVKRIEVFDYIMNNTDCYPWDWKIWDIDKNGNIIKIGGF